MARLPALMIGQGRLVAPRSTLPSGAQRRGMIVGAQTDLFAFGLAHHRTSRRRSDKFATREAPQRG